MLVMMIGVGEEGIGDGEGDGEGDGVVAFGIVVGVGVVVGVLDDLAPEQKSLGGNGKPLCGMRVAFPF
jgi:hypothetical protein